jgi:glucosyl-3-phosphoglycerate synthase
MADQVVAALLRAVEDNGGSPAYDTLQRRYRTAAERLVDAYALDASFNGLTHDRSAEREQVDAYAGAIEPPGADTRLPAWDDVDLTPGAIASAVADDLADVTTTAQLAPSSAR